MGMRRLSFLVCSWILLAGLCANATERQSNADYHARRVALAKQMEGGTLVLFAPTEAEGPNNLYGFRQDDNFYYLTGWLEPGAAVLINANPYVEILFSGRAQRNAGEMDRPQAWSREPAGPAADRL